MDPGEADGSFAVEEDPRVLEAAKGLLLVPTVSNYAPGAFSRELAALVIATGPLRREGARSLAAICEERG